MPLKLAGLNTTFLHGQHINQMSLTIDAFWGSLYEKLGKSKIPCRFEIVHKNIPMVVLFAKTYIPNYSLTPNCLTHPFQPHLPRFMSNLHHEIIRKGWDFGETISTILE